MTPNEQDLTTVPRRICQLESEDSHQCPTFTSGTGLRHYFERDSHGVLTHYLDGPKIDGRSAREPPMFEYWHLIGEKYEKQGEVVLRTY